MKKITKCSGCGALLQTINNDEIGYTKKDEMTYCESCYRLMHYGESKTHFHPKDLPHLPENSLIIMISSVLHLDLLFSYPIYRYQPEATYIYIINQIDLLPKSTQTEKLLEHIIQKAKKEKIVYKDIILMSAKNKFDIEHLSNYIESLNHKNIYLIGVQNSGKTTLFKALTKDNQALAMKKAGLTQNVLSKALNQKMIHDMPGLYQQGYLHQFLNYDQYKKLIPDHEIRPRIYQLKQHQSLIIEGLISISLLSLDQTIVLYLDNHINIHKTQVSKIDELFTHKKLDTQIYVENYTEKTFKIPKNKSQITFADMGFMHIDGPALVSIRYPKHMHLSLSEALFK